MRRFGSDDPEVQRLYEICGRMLGPSSVSMPSIESFVWTLNEASILSSSLYEGEPIKGALALLVPGATPRLSISIPPVPNAQRGQLRSLVMAARHGEVVLRPTTDGRAEAIGVSLEGYGDAFNPRLSFPVFQQVFIGCAGVVVGRLALGRGIAVSENPLNVTEHLAPALDLGGYLSHLRLRELLRAVEETGSGGIVVIDPSDDVGWGDALIGRIEPWLFARRSAELQDSELAIAAFLASLPQMVDTRTGIRAPAEDRRELRERERVRLSGVLLSFGELARSDGAIVLRPSLELAGFGWRLEGKQTPLVRVDHVLPMEGDLQSGERSPLDLGGTRTQGAISFVNARPHCIAFVVSSDGPVSMVHNLGDRVRVLRGLEAFL